MATWLASSSFTSSITFPMPQCWSQCTFLLKHSIAPWNTAAFAAEMNESGSLLTARSWMIWQRERDSNFKSKNTALQTKLRWDVSQSKNKGGVVPNNNHLFILFFGLSEEKCSWWTFCAQTWLSNETLCTSAKPSNGNSVQEQMGACVSSSRNKDLGNQAPLAHTMESVVLVFFLVCNVLNRITISLGL